MSHRPSEMFPWCQKVSFSIFFSLTLCWLNFSLKEVNVPGFHARHVQVTFTWVTKLKSCTDALADISDQIVRVHKQASPKLTSCGFI